MEKIAAELRANRRKQEEVDAEIDEVQREKPEDQAARIIKLAGDKIQLVSHEFALRDQLIRVALRGPGPHCRACGIKRHEHGKDCHKNCPTCRGEEA